MPTKCAFLSLPPSEPDDYILIFFVIVVVTAASATHAVKNTRLLDQNSGCLVYLCSLSVFYLRLFFDLPSANLFMWL